MISFKIQMRKLIILLVSEISIPVNIFFFIILSYFVIFKESYSTTYIESLYHIVRDHVKKGGCYTWIC
jgi:hypothetical protein